MIAADGDRCLEPCLAEVAKVRMMFETHTRFEEEAMLDMQYPYMSAHIVDHVCVCKQFNCTMEDPKKWSISDLMTRILDHIDRHDIQLANYALLNNKTIIPTSKT